MVNDVDLQPLAAQIRRVVEALDMLGQPLASTEKAGIVKAVDTTDPKAGVQALQQIVDRHCLIGDRDQPRKPGQGGPGAGGCPADAERLVGVSGQGPQRGGRDRRASGRQPQRRADLQAVDQQCRAEKVDPSPANVTERWMDVAMFGDRPLKRPSRA